MKMKFIFIFNSKLYRPGEWAVNKLKIQDQNGNSEMGRLHWEGTKHPLLLILTVYL